MPRIFTTPTAEETAKAWLHYVTLAAGLRSANHQPNFSSDFITYAKTICDELINRDFNNIDSAIKHISQYSFRVPIVNGHLKYLKPEAIAKSIVYMADLVQLYWDDTNKTPYEIDEFKKTLLGQAVYKYGKYISAIPDKKNRAPRIANSTGGTGVAGTAQPPKNNYKSSGPQSGNVRDLQGNPNEKVWANGPFIYKIIGDNPQSKNIPNVFIKPLSAAGATGSTNKIFISSGNGYTDCTCYFDEPNDAQAFLDKIIQSGRVPSNVDNLRVVKKQADKNGYFLVGTEFGVCAISAKTLNEALNECADGKLTSWEKATEGYSEKEIEELHTWMRRG